MHYKSWYLHKSLILALLRNIKILVLILLVLVKSGASSVLLYLEGEAIFLVEVDTSEHQTYNNSDKSTRLWCCAFWIQTKAQFQWFLLKFMRMAFFVLSPDGEIPYLMQCLVGDHCHPHIRTCLNTVFTIFAHHKAEVYPSRPFGFRHTFYIFVLNCKTKTNHCIRKTVLREVWYNI